MKANVSITETIVYHKKNIKYIKMSYRTFSNMNILLGPAKIYNIWKRIIINLKSK